MKMPELKNKLVEAIDEYHEKNQEPPRPHLGCSQLGHHCDRFLWFSYRWAVVEKFSGRMLRLFRRGQNEESTIISDLRSVGVDVRSTGSNQSRVDFGWNVSGSIDGLIFGGYHEAMKSRAILECKTHSQKSFDELKKVGVEKAKFQHFVQCQTYMKGTNTDRALYVAINKNDDSIYVEWIHFDDEIATKYIKRGHWIVQQDRMPEPCSTDSSWYQCKYCAGHDLCFGSKLTKEVNCRTCAHSTVTENGFKCERYDAEIPVEHQRTGCEGHVLHPDLVPWKMVEPLDQWTAQFEIEGKTVANGEPDANIFTSRELVSNATACANQDDLVREMRVECGARIDG